ncbi:hypothetical protein [Rhizobium leguminosarum]|uniref:hypothetical protein n=1 Tax=Rhizobium leguminosarum TaxID=384 RepID=UPI0011AE68D9|nr:hypothetical protein [Rhizobium leguminosarum]
MTLKNTFSFENSTSKTITIIVEPWTDEFLLKTGSNMLIEVSANAPGTLETTLNDEVWIIWAWSGCTCRIAIDGEDMTSSFMNNPAP